MLDVDDTTLTTWNYELFSNWDFNPVTNGNFVGLTGGAFTGNLFPATPGMVHLVSHARALGYAVFFLTGRGDAQHAATIANLVNDTAAGFPDIDLRHLLRGRPCPRSTPATRRRRRSTPATAASPTASSPSRRSAHTRPTSTSRSSAGRPSPPARSCPTIQYKSGTRAYIQSQRYDIVANFGDQFSDLKGGFADKTFKMPNPNYFLP